MGKILAFIMGVAVLVGIFETAYDVISDRGGFRYLWCSLPTVPDGVMGACMAGWPS